MHKKWIAVIASVVLIAAIVIPVAAITYGELDDGEHPYVGLIGVYDEDWEWMWRCSGTLLSDTVVLTAGHCTAYDPEYGTPKYAKVWFDEQIFYDPILDDYTNPDFYTGETKPHPLYVGLTIPETHDIGVVILDEPVDGITVYGQLPTAGFLDEMAQKSNKRQTYLTSVGYGVNDVKPEVISLRTRYKAMSFLISLNNALTDGWNIKSSNNPGQWTDDAVTGGTCSGDSGGPVFYGGYESNLVVGITSFGNSNCTGTDYSYRVDIEDSLDFLSQYVE